MRAILVLLAAVLAAALAAAEVVLDLPDPVVPGVVAEGQIIVRDPPANITGIELPAVAGLEWQHTGRSSSQTQVVDGKRSTVLGIGLRLRAAQAGTLQLPAVTVQCADRSLHRSAPRALRAAPGDASLVGDAVASCRFEPATIVPGQPTTLIYRLCLRRGQVSKLGVAPPDGAIALGERSLDENGRTYDAQGQEWKVVTVSWPLTHATPGSYAVGGQQEVQIQIGDGFFDTRVQRKQVAIPPATLTVEPLPAAGRPADFYGLVGPVEASAALDRERLAAGEGAVLALTVKSRQVDLVKRPALVATGAQVYAKDESGGDGQRTFRWDVVPVAPGTVAIPALHLPYFDPATRSYRTADSAALTLVVVPGRNRDLGVVGAAAPTAAAATPTAPAPPALPAPVRGGAGVRPPAWLAPAALAAGLLAGLGLVLARRCAPRRGPHRGHRLRAAAGDPAALAAALAALRPALADPARRAAADALQEALDRHRFGGEPLPDCGAWIAALEGQP